VRLQSANEAPPGPQRADAPHRRRRAHARPSEPARARRADPGLRPAGQETRVLGATALLFHERAPSLAALAELRPPATIAGMDFSLWLARTPPADLPHDRAAFLWWTGVDYRFRRRGRRAVGIGLV